MDRSLETSKEVTGLSSCKDGREQTGSREGGVMLMSCEVIAALRESRESFERKSVFSDVIDL